MADFKSVVEGHSGAAARWSQGKFMGGATFGSGGVCGPLSAVWIRDRKIGTNFNTDTKTAEGRDEVYQLKLNQKKNSEYVKEYLALFSLHRHFSQTWKDEISMSEALGVVTAGPGYYFIGLTNRGTGGQKLEGHAFAVDMFDLKFFDPNSGQASFALVDNLRACFLLWFRLTYMDLRGSGYLERYI